MTDTDNKPYNVPEGNYNEYLDKAIARRSKNILLHRTIENAKKDLIEKLRGNVPGGNCREQVEINVPGSPVRLLITSTMVNIGKRVNYNAKRFGKDIKLYSSSRYGYRVWTMEYISNVPGGIKDVKVFEQYLHQTVATVLFGPKPKGYKYHFIDGNRGNCHPLNLTYVKETKGDQ